MKRNKIDKLGKMKIEICLIIIKSCNERDIFPLMKSFFNLTDFQLHLYFEYLVDQNLVDFYGESDQISLTVNGFSLLRESHLEIVDLEELLNVEPIDFEYEEKIKKFIPNNI